MINYATKSKGQTTAWRHFTGSSLTFRPLYLQDPLQTDLSTNLQGLEKYQCRSLKEKITKQREILVRDMLIAVTSLFQTEIEFDNTRNDVKIKVTNLLKVEMKFATLWRGLKMLYHPVTNFYILS